jgi:imidazolonepropionase-like amidohydrolase
MRSSRLLIALLIGAACVNGAAQTNRPAVLYEGARLIIGDGSAPIDLTRQTVIPALIDAHSHIGYMKDLTSGPQNYTRENILDHMHRFAYFGVAASQAMGSDFGELPFQIKRLQDRLGGQTPEAARQAARAWDRLARGVRTLATAGVKIGVGTDGGGQTGNQFVGWTCTPSSRTWPRPA